MLPWPHGTTTGYSTHRCRCAHCVEAHRLYHVQWRDRQRRNPLPADDRRHGTVNGYSNYGCRCAPCTAAQTAHDRARRGNR